jgi:hypothetical protein
MIVFYAVFEACSRFLSMFSPSERQRRLLAEQFSKLWELSGGRWWLVLLMLPIVVLGFVTAMCRDVWRRMSCKS